LTTVRQIRALTPDQAREARPVRLNGVVTAFSGWRNSFFIQDATGGISVDRTDHADVHLGDRVELIGVSSPGMFAPMAVASSVRVLGHALQPPARRVTSGDVFGGKQDSQRVEVQGVIHSARTSELYGHPVLVLILEFDGGSMRIFDQDYAGIDYDQLIDSTVRVRGVCATTFNQKRQFVGLDLFVPDRRDIDVVQPAPEHPFAAASVPVRDVLQFGQEAHRVKVTGISTYQIPGHALYLQDGSDGILVQTTSTEWVGPGRKVEAVGFPAMGEYAPILKDASFRDVGRAAPVTPVRIDAKDGITLLKGFYNVPYDAQLVQLQGRVLESHIQNGQRVWILEQGRVVFEAYLPLSTTAQGVEDIGSGGVLLLSGICVVHADTNRQPISFGILLRSPQDIVVLQRAPWWSASHAEWVVAFLTMVIFAMAGWMALVRRHAALRLLTVTDPLTGLYNRRGFLLLVKHQWLQALRRKKPFLLVYIDVDHFKDINDSLGHKEGDQALRDLATMLRECFRNTDIIARMGGDEFSVTTDDASPESCQAIEQRLAGILEQKNNSAGRAYKLVLSVGVLTCDSSLQDLSIEDLLAKADALMYQQKREHMSCKA